MQDNNWHEKTKYRTGIKMYRGSGEPYSSKGIPTTAQTEITKGQGEEPSRHQGRVVARQPDTGGTLTPPRVCGNSKASHA